MHLRRIVAIGAMVVVGTVLLRAQQSSSVPANDEIRIGTRPYVPQHGTIRVQTELVEIGAVVRDSNGKVVGGFKKEDFQVLDNGKPQRLTYFDEEKVAATPASSAEAAAHADGVVATDATIVPRYVAIFFDDVDSPAADLTSARNAVADYIAKGLEPGEKVGLFTASSFFTLDFTDDAAALKDALPKVLPHPRRAEDAIGCPRIPPYQAWTIIHMGYSSPEFQVALAEAENCPSNSGVPPGEIAHLVEVQAQRTLDIAAQIADGVFEKTFGVIRKLSGKQGHRVLLFASSGFFAQELQSQREQLVNAALRAKVVVNTLDAKGLYVDADLDMSNGPPTLLNGFQLAERSMIMDTDTKFKDDPLASLAEETGGRFFRNSNDLAREVKELSEAPAVSYVLGFSPVDLDQNGAFHNLKVKLANSQGLTISARQGYYAPTKPKGMAADEKMLKFENEVMAAETLAAIPANLDVMPSKMNNGDSELNLTVHVDISKLPYKKVNDRSAERLVMVTALFNDKNEFLTGEEQFVDLSLKPETRARLAHDGFDAKLSLEAPPGTYRVRQIVLEVATGKLAAINRSVVVQ